MTTRKQLNDLCRRRLGDQFAPTVFSDLQINQWINDAIADYSTCFPRQLETRIPTLAGQREYSLSSLVGLSSVLSVEYPFQEGKSPYLLRRTERDNRGFYGQAVYNLKKDDTGNWVLLIGLIPEEGQILRLVVEIAHPYLDGDEAITTVPDFHLELMVLFVRAAAMQEQLAHNAAQPELSSLLLSTLAANANRAINEYQQKKKEYLTALSNGGSIETWQE